jgi:serine protease Do
MMKTKMVVGCLVGLMVAGSLQSATYAPPVVAKTASETTANSVYQRANPAVVTVRIGERSHGSGFIISKDGFVITNAHVAGGAPSVVTLMMADGKTEIPADVVGFAKGGVDLAILKINGRSNLPTVKLGTTRSIQVGDRVYAIGTPLFEANANTFTMGIVSALRSSGVIQHSAAISPGNSGGPLLNGNGEVIGVNTAISTISGGNEGIAFAVNVDDIKTLLADFKTGNLSSVSTLER